MKKFRFSDFAFLLCIYLAIAFFPLSLFSINDFYIQIIGIALRAVYLIFIFVYLNKRKIINLNRCNFINCLLLFPCFVVCFSNLIVATIAGSFNTDVEFSNFYVEIIFCLMTALCEEMIFRMAGFKAFESKKPIVRILIVSALFGVAHLFNFFNSYNLLVFVQATYTFFIGILLGLMYEYGENIGLPILFHFAFNVFNNNLFNKIAVISDDFKYYLINILIGVVCGVYCLIIYFSVLRKKGNK